MKILTENKREQGLLVMVESSVWSMLLSNMQSMQKPHPWGGTQGSKDVLIPSIAWGRGEGVVLCIDRCNKYPVMHTVIVIDHLGTSDNPMISVN